MGPIENAHNPNTVIGFSLGTKSETKNVSGDSNEFTEYMKHEGHHKKIENGKDQIP
ncbi:MAG: hypothetical protein GY874_10730 [Desulfobacteraceae bacterium]|nr:hypothetical protein [Desulfobacteraceae bacterium]